jgi:hypothetical protein
MRNWLAFVSVSVLAAACGSDSKNPAPTTTCGTGTVLSGTMCVPDGTGSGNNVTCGTGTHLSGTMCVPDTSTPGAPTIAMITPTKAGAAGLEVFQIVGTNLAGVDPTMVHVYFGDTTPGTGGNLGKCEAAVAAVDDTTIAGQVPPFCGIDVTVTVHTDQGEATTAFHYLALFAVDGDNVNGTGGDLYVIDPVNVVSGYWASPNDGTNGYNFDGIAFNTAGTLYGVTTGNSQGDTNGAQLMTIDPATGTVTALGALVDSGAKHYYVTDIKFSGATLYGYGYSNPTGTQLVEGLVTIDPTNGTVTRVGTAANATLGIAGLAVDAGGVVYVAANGAGADATNGATGVLDTADTTSGALTSVQTLDYPIGADIDGMEYIGTTLVAIVDNGLYGTDNSMPIYGTQLAVIDPTAATGNIGAQFELPAANGAQSAISAFSIAPGATTIAHNVRRTAWTKLPSASVGNHK